RWIATARSTLQPCRRKKSTNTSRNEEETMKTWAKFAVMSIVGVLASIPQGAAIAADLVILTNQGATPGVKELAAGFSRATGHKVTVIQADDALLQQKINDVTADLVTGNPG